MTAFDATLAAQSEQLGPPLAAYIGRQRWGSRAHPILRAEVEDIAVLPAAEASYLLALVRAETEGGGEDRYFVPLSSRYVPEGGPGSRDPARVAEVALAVRALTLTDAFADAGFRDRLLRAVAGSERLATERGGYVAFGGEDALSGLLDAGDELTSRVGSAEQSNTSVIYGDRLILKAFRKLQAGVNPDLEIGRFLSAPGYPPGADTGEPRFTGTPQTFGWAEWSSAGGRTYALATLQAFVRSEGDGWAYTLDTLGQLGAVSSARRDVDPDRLAQWVAAPYLRDVAELGATTARLHVALASDTSDSEFRPEPITPDDVAAWTAAYERQLGSVLAMLGREQSGRTSAGRSEVVQRGIDRLTAQRDRLLRVAGALPALAETGVEKIRYHGDYHLGQVLKGDAGWMILDFEGEPLRPLEQRRAKGSPLKDVAGMLRSFNYARGAAFRDQLGAHGPPLSPEDVQGLAAIGATWERAARQSFLDGYFAVAPPGAAPFLPDAYDAVNDLIRFFELDKAIYEIAYELNHRPDWLAIPLDFVVGAIEALGQGRAREAG